MSHDDRHAVRTMLRRAQVVSSDDTGSRQLLTLTGLASEQLSKVLRIQQFGLTSNMPVGADGLLACLGGRSDRAVFVGGEDQKSRVKNLPIGGVALYDAFGQVLKFIEQNVELVCGTLTITATKVVVVGPMHVGSASANTPVALAGGASSTTLFAQ